MMMFVLWFLSKGWKKIVRESIIERNEIIYLYNEIADCGDGDWLKMRTIMSFGNWREDLQCLKTVLANLLDKVSWLLIYSHEP